MDTRECKKYIKRAYTKMKFQGKQMTPQILEIEMKREIEAESRILISYSKLAMHNLNKTATEITAHQLEKQIDDISILYNQLDVIAKAQNL